MLASPLMLLAMAPPPRHALPTPLLPSPRPIPFLAAELLAIFACLLKGEFRCVLAYGGDVVICCSSSMYRRDKSSLSNRSCR